MKDYETYLKSIGVNMPAAVWFILVLVLALIVSSTIFLLSPHLFNVAILLGVFIVIGFTSAPIMIKQRRDSVIAQELPDVLEELATSLRAGATIEQALVDLLKLQKGPLIEELKMALRDMEGGLSFEESLENMIDRVDVQSLKRILNIIIDGRKAGGELARILDEVAKDARDLARIQRERISKTMLQVIFLFVAGMAVAPFVFGVVTVMTGLLESFDVCSNPLELSLPIMVQETVPSCTDRCLIERGEVCSEKEIGGKVIHVTKTNLTLNKLWLYLLIESIFSGAMISTVRGEKLWKGVFFYGGFMAVLGTIIFEIAKAVAKSRFGF